MNGGAPAAGLNVFTDVATMLQYDFMRNAFLAGSLVAIVAGVVGYFVVLRNLSFAGHALAHIGYAGATGAVLLGLPALSGLLTFNIAAAGMMGALGKRIFGRDVAIGAVMAFSLGLGQLFVSLYHGGGSATQSYSILFGEVLGISPGDVTVTAVISVLVLLLVAAIARPLFYASVDAATAEARGVPVRAVGVAFLAITGLTVAQSVQVTGVLLIFALLIVPPAIAQRLCARPAPTVILAVALSLLLTWLALGCAFYTSYPVSFYLTALAFAAYVITRIPSPVHRPRGAT